MRWVQKIVEGGAVSKHTTHVVLDEETPGLEGITPEEAARLVASGDWKYVTDDRPQR